jgi:hypothetical protein
MKPIPLLLFSLLIGTFGYSQTTSPEVIGSSGDHFINGDAQISWTIGETMVATFINDSIQLSQGFHQTSLTITAIEDLEKDFGMKVYPNPTADLLHFEWPENTQALSLVLFDIDGKQLWVKQMGNQAMSLTLDLSAYPAATYFLHIYQQDQQRIKTLTILKHNN